MDVRKRTSSDLTVVNENASQDIPLWIKNNVEWWSEGKISDSEFALGIKYFIENRIIRV